MELNSIISYLSAPAAILIATTTTLQILVQEWRLSIILLTLQFLGAAVLLVPNWPLELVSAFLISGWMSGAVLGMAAISMPPAARHTPGALRRFGLTPFNTVRLISALLSLMVVASLVPLLGRWLPGVNPVQTWGGLLLITLGLLQLGFTTSAFRTSIGLLTILSGFIIFYSAVESSSLLGGLLAAINLSLALAGAYLILSPGMVEDQ
jgi:hypothetical protein